MNQKPPRVAKWLLEQMLYDDIWKTPLGDFDEYFNYLVQRDGARKANAWYWWQVLHYIPSKILHSIYWTAQMFKNYLKISLRGLQKNKSYSFINISGLAIGLASFILIGLFVRHELSYDKHLENHDRIYRLVKQNPGEEYMGTNWFAVTPLPLHVGLKENFPQFETTAYAEPFPSLIKVGTASFFEDGISVGGDFFDTFSYRWLQGDSKTALNEPNAIILTESIAKKYFGNRNPLGETIEFTPEGESEVALKTVTGVIEDLPTTTHLYFTHIINGVSSRYYEDSRTHWDSNNYFTYVKLAEGIELTDEFKAELGSYYSTQMQTRAYYSVKPELTPILDYQQLKDIHLKSMHLNFTGGNPGDIKYVYTLSLIGIIILLIACVNYMNLATARAVMRAKEVGVRKVIGALRTNLITQFISEAVLLSFFSISLAVLIVRAFLPSFRDMVGRSIGMEFFVAPEFWAFLLGISVLVGLIAGSYPAFYMSALKPAGILKSNTKGGKTNSFMRNALVTGQFAITTILIISSIVIFRQLQFIQSSDVGYSRDQILTVKISDDDFFEQYETVAQNLSKHSDVLSVTSAQYLPNFIESQTSGVRWEGKQEDERVSFHLGDINYGYLEMLNIDLLAGEYFSEGKTPGYIINESAMKSIGLNLENVIGASLTVWRNEGTITGVIKDFNFLSFRQEISPLILKMRPTTQTYLLMKVSTDNLPETIAYVEEQVKLFSPDYPFDYAFLDDAFDSMYKTDLSLGKLFNTFTILALFIASIGLFGLAAFMMEQRAKEIGIRKVLGANLVQILTLVNKDFMRLIGLSFLIAIPIGWYAMNTWLQDFAYRIELGPSIFITAGVMAILVAILTVSYKSVKTAMANPVKSLKSE